MFKENPMTPASDNEQLAPGEQVVLDKVLAELEGIDQSLAGRERREAIVARIQALRADPETDPEVIAILEEAVGTEAKEATSEAQRILMRMHAKRVSEG